MCVKQRLLLELSKLVIRRIDASSLIALANTHILARPLLLGSGNACAISASCGAILLLATTLHERSTLGTVPRYPLVRLLRDLDARPVKPFELAIFVVARNHVSE